MNGLNLDILFDAQEVSELLRDIDSAQLGRDFNVPDSVDSESALPLVRLAAIASFAKFFFDFRIDTWLRQGESFNEERETEARNIFKRWNGYFGVLMEADLFPDIDDLLFFAAIGLVARRPNEVRDFLRRPLPRKWLDGFRQGVTDDTWINRVRNNISLAVLFSIRQTNHADIRATGDVLKQLASDQKEIEPLWLEAQDNQQRDAVQLLGFYHVAQAVLRTSEFLLTGSVVTDGRVISDFYAELRRLLVRAEEFLDVLDDAETYLWLKSVAITLILLRESSIWVQARGISKRIDDLLEELTHVGRDQIVFSLLPSQQDAIRQSLLDRTQVAIILQMPTSTGKTLLAEFAIAQTFDAYRDKTKVVYVVPTRALATQARRTLVEDLTPLGISVSAAGSAFEEDPYELHLLQEADGVVVATPEKLDLMLRAHPEWFKDLRLVVVDEAHLLNDGERGVRLELLLSNLRREQPEARLLLLTPFVDNAKEIANWLNPSRNQSVKVVWRPSKVLLGLASIAGSGRNRALTIEWQDPFDPIQPKPLRVPTSVPYSEVQSNAERVVFLAEKVQHLGTTLAIFSASPGDAEKVSTILAQTKPLLAAERTTPQLRLAISLARHQYGQNSSLAFCLERGIAFHHSSLSSIMRYLIEDQIRAKTISFVGATSTLAQGMNFPVATVLIHSVHKPYGGRFTSGEFWNIAGRAGRVGMIEKGLIIFVDPAHRSHYTRYGSTLSESLKSALLLILNQISTEDSIKDQYRQHPELRPFIQYLAHAAANSSPRAALTNLEELLEQSLINQQCDPNDARKLRRVATVYLQELVRSRSGLLKVADTSGLGSFSFEELFGKLRNNAVLQSGPQAVLQRRESGLAELVEALRWLPELDLAIGMGSGPMNVQAVANVVQGWIDGKQVHELAAPFQGEDEETKIRKAARYIYSTISQNMSWGAHAYLRGWGMTQSTNIAPKDAMLPSYIQYGVHSPEAAVASLLGIPREFAEAFGSEYIERFGQLSPEKTGAFKTFVEESDEKRWKSVISKSSLNSVDPGDMNTVFRSMQGITSK